MNSEIREQRKGLSANWAVREVDHLFTRFARYTRFVLYSKWFLGIFALLLLTVLVVWPMVSKDKTGMRISFVGTSSMPGKGSVSPTMNNPIFEGTDKNGQPYKLVGARAVQATSELVVVEKVEGQLLTKNSFVSLMADRAEYRQKRNSIDLLGNVNIIHGEGYTFVTQAAQVNTKTMDVTGSGKIEGEGPLGNLLATGFQIRDNGNIIRFGGKGRVTVVIEKTKAS